MAAMDEFRKEREAIKYAGFKEKVAYFWDYYKWYVIIPVVVIAIISNLIYHKITDPEIILEGVFLNVYNSSSDSEYTISDLIEAFKEEQNIDVSEYDVSFRTSYSYVSETQSEASDGTGITMSSAASTNYTTLQALQAQAGAGCLDFIAGPQDSMRELAYKGYFADLSEVLTEEQYALYEPYFLYMDMGAIEEYQEAYDNGDYNATISVPDTMSPENMTKPIPVYIDISKCSDLIESYGYDVGTVVFGMVASAPNPDVTLDFIDYLMK